MFFLLYTNRFGHAEWEMINGEDAMQWRVWHLVSELGCTDEDIKVFRAEDKF